MSSVLATGLIAIVVLAVGSAGTLSSWTSAQLLNSANSTNAGQLAITHAYNSTSCIGTARAASVACSPTLGTSSSPSASSTDAITNNSGAAVTQSVTGASCGPVQLANSRTTGDPMLPRSGTSFSTSGGPSAVSGSGAVTVDTSAYAAGVSSATLGGSPSSLLGLGTYHYYYGYGVWFRTTASSGRIFGLGSNPTNTPSSGSTTFDRSLSLSAGKLSFAASGANTASTSKTYNDGAWHYAYVSLQADTFYLVLGLSYTTTVSINVDGTTDGTSSASSQLATPSGYWFLGPGFAGSLSNFSVYNTTTSPTTPPSAPYSGATELWPLNDNGYTTYTGTLPSSISAPCSKVNIAFAFTNPTAAIAAQSLTSFANNSARSVAAPASGSTQALTISTTQGTGYTSDIAGLHLYVPLTFSYSTSPATSWTQTFTWSADPLDVFWA